MEKKRLEPWQSATLALHPTPFLLDILGQASELICRLGNEKPASWNCWEIKIFKAEKDF